MSLQSLRRTLPPWTLPRSITHFDHILHGIRLIASVSNITYIYLRFTLHTLRFSPLTLRSTLYDSRITFYALR